MAIINNLPYGGKLSDDIFPAYTKVYSKGTSSFDLMLQKENNKLKISVYYTNHQGYFIFVPIHDFTAKYGNNASSLGTFHKGKTYKFVRTFVNTSYSEFSLYEDDTQIYHYFAKLTSLPTVLLKEITVI